jgi:cytochrome b561
LSRSGLGSLADVPLRNGEHGYGVATKLLHWLTVAALATQFAVGLTMEADAAAERAEEAADAREDAAKDFADAAEDAAGSEAEEEAAEEAGERAEEAADAAADSAADTEYLLDLGDGVDLIDVHVLLGVCILLLAFVRVWWRRAGGLPPWAPALSAQERVVAGWTEKALLACLFLVPSTGLVLVFTQDDALLPAHIAAQVLLGIAVLAHVSLVLRHTLLHRNRLLHRMLPGRSATTASSARNKTEETARGPATETADAS